MSIPEQVRRQSEAIARMYAAGESGEAPAASADVQSAAPADGGAPVAEPTPPEQPAPAPVANDTAEQRYRTLQGMYNADRARHQAELAQRDARLAQLEQLLSSMQAAAPRAPTPAAPAEEKLVTSKDVEEYGDSLDVMRRVSREELAAANRRVSELEQMIRQLQTNVVPRVEQVAQRQAQSAEQDFWSELSGSVPAWKEINNDPQFHKWLLEVDPLTGSTRQTYLADAQSKLDARRVASFFTTWQRMSGPETAQPTRDAAASELERQIAPGRSRASNSSPASTAQGKTYTRTEIAKFFDDVRRGTYRGREAERDRIERDIFAAQQDKRIIANG